MTSSSFPSSDRDTQENGLLGGTIAGSAVWPRMVGFVFG